MSPYVWTDFRRKKKHNFAFDNIPTNACLLPVEKVFIVKCITAA
jgi:hypothetical protein